MITIVASNNKLKPGSIQTLNYCDGNLIIHNNVRAFILRKASKEEYLKFCQEDGVPEIRVYNTDLYYAVSFD